ncbi:MAG: hypothetical protein QM756_29825 [Polyangiaceae bacterium]
MKAINETIQVANILSLKGGKLTAQFDWDRPVSTTVICTYLYLK